MTDMGRQNVIISEFEDKQKLFNPKKREGRKIEKTQKSVEQNQSANIGIMRVKLREKEYIVDESILNLMKNISL